MAKTETERLHQARTILRNPFGMYPDLDQRERKALTALVHGATAASLAHELGGSVRTAYNVVDRALLKISRAEGHLVTREEIFSLAWRKLGEALAGKEA